MMDILQSPLLALIASTSMAVLFAQAALHKLADVALWRQHLSDYGVRQGNALLAWGLMLAEGLIAVGLLTPCRPWAAGAACLQLLVYAAGMAAQLRRGRVIDCGCGGMDLPVSWALVVRNAVLALWCLLGTQPVAMDTLVRFDFVWVVAAVFLGTVMYVAVHQVLRHQAWLSMQGMNKRRMG